MYKLTVLPMPHFLMGYPINFLKFSIYYKNSFNVSALCCDIMNKSMNATFKRIRCLLADEWIR